MGTQNIFRFKPLLKLNLLFLLWVFLIPQHSQAQDLSQTPQQDTTSYWALTVLGAYKISMFNFNERFGNPTAIGMGVNYIKENGLFSINGTYWFGTRHKNDSLLKRYSVRNEYLFNKDNALIPFRLSLQGVDINFGYSKKLSGELEGGWFMESNLGTYWYKTLIVMQEESPSITKEVKKGIDELVIGGSLNLGIAYKNISNTLNSNYSFALSYQLGIGKNVRGYSYAKEKTLPTYVLDGFLNLNFRYYFPLKPKADPSIIDDWDEDWD